jgi:hypothetical protein
MIIFLIMLFLVMRILKGSLRTKLIFFLFISILAFSYSEKYLSKFGYLNKRLNIILLILLVLIIGFLLFFINYSKNFENFNLLDDTNIGNNQAPYVSDEGTKDKPINDLTKEQGTNMKCCLIEKKYVPSSEGMYGGNFKYIFKKLENENCDLKLFRLDNNKQLFIEGNNNWNNNDCDENVKEIGSCRWVNKECVDFVDKEFCDKYKMTWSEETCHNATPYRWQDPINLQIPKPTDNGEYIMFKKF